MIFGRIIGTNIGLIGNSFNETVPATVSMDNQYRYTTVETGR